MQVCRFFGSARGCVRGDACRFAHLAAPPRACSGQGCNATTTAFHHRFCVACYERRQLQMGNQKCATPGCNRYSGFDLCTLCYQQTLPPTNLPSAPLKASTAAALTFASMHKQAPSVHVPPAAAPATTAPVTPPRDDAVAGSTTDKDASAAMPADAAVLSNGDVAEPPKPKTPASAWSSTAVAARALLPDASRDQALGDKKRTGADKKHGCATPKCLNSTYYEYCAECNNQRRLHDAQSKHACASQGCQNLTFFEYCRECNYAYAQEQAVCKQQQAPTSKNHLPWQPCKQRGCTGKTQGEYCRGCREAFHDYTRRDCSRCHYRHAGECRC